MERPRGHGGDDDLSPSSEAARMLREMALRDRGEPELPDELLRSNDQLQQDEERAKVRRMSKGEVSMITTLANEIFSIKEVLSSSVACPRCGIGISRVSGCDHMRCRNCGKQFDYSRAGRTNVTAVDFIEGDEAHEEPRDRLPISVRQHPCPQCRQPRPKIGNNNHLICGACQTHYCALCRKVVRKSSEHYGPRGCKQHTVDPEAAQAATDNKDDSVSELL